MEISSFIIAVELGRIVYYTNITKKYMLVQYKYTIQKYYHTDSFTTAGNTDVNQTDCSQSR